MTRNHSDYTPAAVMVLDTESKRVPTADGEDQSLRLWCARYVLRRPQSKMAPRDEEHWGTDVAGLAQLIGDRTRSVKQLWCYAHNLGYDLQASGLLEALATLGWSVTAASSVSRYLWLSMARHTGSCALSPGSASYTGSASSKCRCPTIRFADTVHMWPMKLAAIGDLLGLPKLPMPAEDADESQWARYCMRDVDVAMTALLQAMAHWDERKLGRWAITNAATAFNCLRHTLPGRPPVLFDEPEGPAWDRAAIYGGRRQCWKHGDLPHGRYLELDFADAYATVGANYPLPFKRGAWFDSLPVDDKRVDNPMITCIAECDIETGAPRFPVRVDGAVDYPIGRFTTILAGPEIAWARETGCLRRIGRGQWHLLGTGYQPFFRRVLARGQDGRDDVPLVVQAIWKQAGRTAVGKFAQHGYVTEPTGMLSDKTLFYEQEIDADSGQQSGLVHYGGQVWRVRTEGDGHYAYPAVTAMVESRVRVALGKAAELAGGKAMVLCDTDGLWCSASAIEAGETGPLPFALADYPREARIEGFLDYANTVLEPFRLREKAVSERMRIAGPQIYDAGPASKASGRPRNLQRQDDSTWAGQTFPAFAWQQHHSKPGVFKTRLESWQWPATRIRGWCLSDGRVLPLQVWGEDGDQAAIVPWRQDGAYAYGVPLAPVQHPALNGKWNPDTDTAGRVNYADNAGSGQGNTAPAKASAAGCRGRGGTSP